MLCQYKNILGIPNQGIHKYRFFNMAIMDIIMTIIGAFIISYIFSCNFWIILVFLFLLGIILHRVFCVKTTVDKALFS